MSKMKRERGNEKTRKLEDLMDHMNRQLLEQLDRRVLLKRSEEEMTHSLLKRHLKLLMSSKMT